jgi:hypothetical protein
MKKNRTMRLAALLLVLTLITSCFVGGTFAKYVSTANNEDSARVAKWAFEVNDANIVTAETFTFDLFKTINDSDGTSLEENIAKKDGTTIAPGTSGEFAIKLENLSEVDAKYGIDYTVTKSDDTLPIEFSVNNGATWAADIADVIASDTDTKLAHTNGTTTITVQWKWDFGTSDAVEDAVNKVDTTLGNGGAATVTVKAVVTATQID